MAVTLERLGPHAWLGAALILWLGACELVAGLNEIEFTVAASSSSTAGGGGQGGGQACEHALYPSPPSVSDPGPDDVAFVAAVRRLDFGETDLANGPTVGYDLDGFCTCQGQGDSCREPDFADADHCDGPIGRDNAMAQLFAQTAAFSNDLSSEFHSQRAETGQWTFLVRVDEYNGLPNDLAVRVALYVSPGFDVDPCTPSITPAWDGTDVWPVGHASLEPPGAGGAGGAAGGGGAGGMAGAGGAGGNCVTSDDSYDVDRPRYVDPGAYVVGGTLVASLPEIGISLESGSTTPEIRMTAGFLTGRVTRDGGTGRWRIDDGLLVGRWQVVEVMKAVVAMLSDGEVVCTDHLLYEPIEEAVCNHLDIASQLGGPTTPCDAISVAIGFEAEQALLGSVYVTSGVPGGCPPATDPANDSCP